MAGLKSAKLSNGETCYRISSGKRAVSGRSAHRLNICFILNCDSVSDSLSGRKVSRVKTKEKVDEQRRKNRMVGVYFSLVWHGFKPDYSLDLGNSILTGPPGKAGPRKEANIMPGLDQRLCPQCGVWFFLLPGIDLPCCSTECREKYMDRLGKLCQITKTPN